MKMAPELRQIVIKGSLAKEWIGRAFSQFEPDGAAALLETRLKAVHRFVAIGIINATTLPV